MTPRHVVTFHRAKTVEFSEDDYARIKKILGKEPMRFPGKRELKPWLTVDYRVHFLATWWFEHIEKPGNEKTVRQYGSAIRMWIDYLVNEAGLWDANEFHSDAWIAGPDGFAATGHIDHHLRNFRKFLTDERPDEFGGTVSDARWNGVLTVVKQFHEAVNPQWKVPLPFDPKKVMVAGQEHTSTELGLGGTSGTTGHPVIPARAQELLAGALRIHPDGKQDVYAMASRDHAFIALAFASGMRLNNLRWITHYEIPPADTAGRGLNPMRVAAAITKGKKGSAPVALERLLRHTRNFINDRIARPCVAYAPENPIWIDRADMNRWSGYESSGRAYEDVPWNMTGGDLRNRMVDIDGSSPVVFKTGAGEPMSAETAGNITKLARKWTRDHINAAFPEDFTTHDCRHSFAVFMVLVLLAGRLDDLVNEEIKDVFSGCQTKVDAIKQVQAWMGHTSTDTTVNTYLTMLTTFELSGVTADDVLRLE